MKFTPGFRARPPIRAATPSSVRPPNVIVPKHDGDAFSALRPRPRYSIAPSRPLAPWPLSSLHQTSLNAPMGNRVPARPTLAALFGGFVSIGMMSFGGGLAAWMRREVVQRRGWMDDPQFLSGYALSQLV